MELKVTWENHEWYKDGKVEMVPTEWVYKYWGTDVSPPADLGDGSPATMDELWEDIQKNGMSDPLMMRAGVKNKKMRLESGNHRIQIFHKHGVEMIPVVVHVQEECGPHVEKVWTDATSNFDATDELLVSEVTEEYMKPSEVFKSLSRK